MSDSPRVAIVHYHLRTGGVTRVIAHAVSALAARGAETVVLTGEPSPDINSIPSAVAVVPGLGYDAGPSSPGAVRERMEEAARRALGGPPDLWHLHNHALGKNLVLPAVVESMARDGVRLCLQVHDFAEDGRPENYRSLRDGLGGEDASELGARLYPQASHVHYAVLNGRDQAFLERAGVAPARLHLLPNAAALPGTEASVSVPSGSRGEGRLFLYPTRAIRRKNVGEFLLWAAVAREGDRFAVSLAPENPAARPVYHRWVACASGLGLPVEFEYGRRLGGDALHVMQSADALVTTSVAEGFGLAFLEPWLAGRPLVGRNVLDITADFDAAGIDLGGLYERAAVPVEWVGADELQARLAAAMETSMRAYGRSVSARDVDTALEAAVRDGAVDFGRLDEEMQEEVIRRLSGSRDAQDELQPTQLEASLPGKDVVVRNRARIEETYSLASYGERLLRVYRTVMASDVSDVSDFDGEKLLDQFLDPARFFLIRS